MSVGILQRSLAVLILPFVTRVLSPADYGRISVVVTTLTLVGVIFASAIEVPLFRALARGGFSTFRIVHWSRLYLVCVLPLACLSLCVLLAAMRLGGLIPDPWLWVGELMSAGLVASLTYYGLPVLRATDRLARYFFVATAWMTTMVVTKLLFLGCLLPGPPGWIASDLVSAAVAWMSVLLFVRPKIATSGTGDGGPEDSEPRTPGQFVLVCLPLVPHRLSFWALTSLSRPALILVSTASFVGLFSFAVNVAAISMMLLAELNRSVLLEYSRESFPAPTTNTRSIAQAQFAAAFVVPTLVAIGVALTGSILIGPDFHDSVRLVGLLLVGQVAYGIYLVPMNYLVQSAGLFKWSSLASVLGAALILAAILAAGRFDSAWLVAVGNSAGYVVMAVCAFLLIRWAKLSIRWSGLTLSWDARVLLPAAFVAGTAALAVFPGGATYVLAGAAAIVLVLAGALAARSSGAM